MMVKVNYEAQEGLTTAQVEKFCVFMPFMVVCCKYRMVYAWAAQASMLSYR